MTLFQESDMMDTHSTECVRGEKQLGTDSPENTVQHCIMNDFVSDHQYLELHLEALLSALPG